MSTETELSSVNSILGAIGQAPVSRLYREVNGELVYTNPEISFIHNLLKEVNVDVQNEGWVWNREEHYPLTPEVDGCIYIPPNVLRMDVSEGQVYRDTDVVRRDGKLYDKVNHTYKFEKQLDFDITWQFSFEDIPSVFQRYITLRASGRAATQLVTNKELVQLLATQEAQARAACVEYECNQGDHTFFGTPDNTAYRSYQPYRTLMR
tara:strand:- start:585 stop:1205 length:621 start_codon:yes stop_codon:yes gene_type:complete